MKVENQTRELLARLTEVVGDAQVLLRAEDQASYLREWRDRYVGKALAVVRPASTDEVARILALCDERNVGVVPQGGNTGLVGGQIPSTSGAEIVLSLQRLNKTRSVDADGGSMILEAGVTLLDAQQIAEKAGRLFPLSLASEGSAEIGGVLASNAGGTAVLAYGNARNLCLGLECVLADGRIWQGLRTLKKDNTGYDLRDLMIGSEGTLGIITAAALKLFPRAKQQATAVVALDSPKAALQVFRLAEEAAGNRLTAFEFWVRRAMEFAIAYTPGHRDPFDAVHPWYALIEISREEAHGQAVRMLELLLTDASEKGLIRDAVIASSLQSRADFWRLRECLSEAQKGAGGSIKHDVSVPVSRIPEFLERAAPVVEKVCPGARPVPFGHFGDGNVHYNVSQPEGMDRAKFLGLWDVMSEAVHDCIHGLGGSISAEHGIGQMKREMLCRYKPVVELDMMRAIKKALDPKGILNPGKVI